jgi:hypothetical protein
MQASLLKLQPSRNSSITYLRIIADKACQKYANHIEEPADEVWAKAVNSNWDEAKNNLLGRLFRYAFEHLKRQELEAMAR